MASHSPTATLREIPFDEALQQRAAGAAFLDVRPAAVYLEGHIPGSLALHYETGPGMASRARDCLPLDVHLILLGFDHGDLRHAAASLRGKGFSVVGVVEDPMRHWVARFGTPRATELVNEPPETGVVLDVGDPGARSPSGALRIPVEQLWPRARDLAEHDRVAVVAGAGVRAALAVGILEQAGVKDVVVWRPEAADDDQPSSRPFAMRNPRARSVNG